METTIIWQEFNKDLFRFIKSKVKDYDISNDILQSVFIKIHQNISKLQDKTKLKSWIYSITNNSIMDYFNENKKLKKEEIGELEIPEEIIVENNCFDKCLTDFVNNLPDLYQDAIKNTILINKSQKEYSEDIGISYTGAKSRVQRAKIMLKTQIEKSCMMTYDKYGNVVEVEHCEVCTC